MARNHGHSTAPNNCISISRDARTTFGRLQAPQQRLFAFTLQLDVSPRLGQLHRQRRHRAPACMYCNSCTESLCDERAADSLLSHIGISYTCVPKDRTRRTVEKASLTKAAISIFLARRCSRATPTARKPYGPTTISSAQHPFLYPVPFRLHDSGYCCCAPDCAPRFGVKDTCCHPRGAAAVFPAARGRLSCCFCHGVEGF